MKLKVLWTVMMAFALACTLAVGASAQDRDDRDHQMTQDRDQNHTDRDDRWENRKDWDYRTYQGDRRPEGWSEGQRTDSRYCGGQRDCYTYSYNNSPYYYYRDDNGRMIVRRRHNDNDRDDYKSDRNRDEHHDKDDDHRDRN